jgi:hypothetical protein
MSFIDATIIKALSDYISFNDDNNILTASDLTRIDNFSSGYKKYPCTWSRDENDNIIATFEPNLYKPRFGDVFICNRNNKITMSICCKMYRETNGVWKFWFLTYPDYENANISFVMDTTARTLTNYDPNKYIKELPDNETTGFFRFFPKNSNKNIICLLNAYAKGIGDTLEALKDRIIALETAQSS